MQRCFIFSVVSLFFISRVFSQTLFSGNVDAFYSYTHYTLADGLPQIQCSRIVSDKKGFIWIGTKFGAARFDGKEFMTFTPRDKIPGSQVIAFAELSDGSMAIGYSNASFSLVNGNMIKSYLLPIDRSAYDLYMIYRFQKQKLLLVCIAKNFQKAPNPTRIILFNQKTDRFEQQFSLPSAYLTYADDNGRLIGLTYKDSNLIDTIRVDYYQWNKLIETRKLYGKILVNFSSYPSRDNLIEFPSWPGRFYRFGLTNGRIDTIPSLNIPENDCSYSNSSVIYTNNSGKKLYYLNNKNQITKLENGVKEQVGELPFVNQLHEGIRGNLWVCTEGGLYCFFRQAFKEIHFNVNPGQMDDIWSMTRDKQGQYYFSCWRNESWTSDPAMKSWKSMSWIHKDPMVRKDIYGGFGAISTSLGGTIIPAGIGFFYIKQDGKRKYFKMNPIGQIFGSIEDSINHVVYLHQLYALYKFDEKRQKLESIERPPELSDNSIMSLCFDTDRSLLVCGRGGAFKYAHGLWSALPGCNINITSAFKDSLGGLWFSDRINLYSYKLGKLRRLTSLPTKQMVLALTEYTGKWLVIGGSVELIFLDLNSYYKSGIEFYYRYDSGAGLNILEGGQNNFFTDRDGSIYWPCVDKLMKIYPQRILKSQIPNSPVLLNILAYFADRPELAVIDSAGSGRVELPKGYRTLEFLFTTPIYNNNSILKYRYRLKGLESDWSLPTALQQEKYSSLNPGKYIFEVQCSLDGINWSKSTQSQTIVVPPYFFETTVHRVIELFTILLVSWFIISYILRKRRKSILAKVKDQQQINELKLRAIRTKAIPHFSSNVYNNIDYLIENEQYKEASQYVALMSRMHSKLLSNADRSSQSLSEELEFVATYVKLEQLRFKKKLNYSVQVNPGVKTNIQIPFMVVHTYVENAIKHGLMSKKGFGKVEVEILDKEQGIEICVTDNGIGRKAAALMNPNSTGMGLSIFEKQIEIFNLNNKQHIVQKIEDLYDPNGNPSGTRFSLYVPYNFNFEI